MPGAANKGNNNDSIKDGMLYIYISIEKIGSALMGLMPPMGAPVRPSRPSGRPAPVRSCRPSGRPSPVRPSRPSGRPSPVRPSRPSGRPARPSVRCRWNRQDMASIYIYIYTKILIKGGVQREPPLPGPLSPPFRSRISYCFLWFCILHMI